MIAQGDQQEEPSCRENFECSFPDAPPYADLVLDAFGPRRMMWGGDWPPVSDR